MHPSSIIKISRFLFSILLKGYIKQLLNPLNVVYVSFSYLLFIDHSIQLFLLIYSVFKLVQYILFYLTVILF